MNKTETITVKAKFGKEAQLKSELHKLVLASKNEDGCLNYQIVQSSDDPRVFMGYMEYENEDAFNRHESSDAVQNFLNNHAPILIEGEPKFVDWRQI